MNILLKNRIRNIHMCLTFVLCRDTAKKEGFIVNNQHTLYTKIVDGSFLYDFTRSINDNFCNISTRSLSLASEDHQAISIADNRMKDKDGQAGYQADMFRDMGVGHGCF